MERELVPRHVTGEDVVLLDFVRNLCREFQSLLASMGCELNSFQAFEDELAALPGKYCAAKRGSLYVLLTPKACDRVDRGEALSEEEERVSVAGCIALRQHVRGAA